MRLNKKIFDAVKSGVFVGDTRYVGRVTVEPDWQLRETPPVYGSHPRDSIRGPYRYYQRQANDQVEIEIPNIKSFTIDGDIGQDVATCKIQMYNQWHHPNMEKPDAAGQLGKPGYFWPQRAMSSEAAERWNQTPAVGAFDKHGNWDGGFQWRNCLVPNALLRTYEGVGGQGKSIQQALDDGDLMLTGVWLVDSVTGGTDGVLKLDCRDIGRLLLDQLVYPPLVPPALYPLEYYPEGESPFDSFWTPPPSSDQLSPGEYGTVRVRYHSSSADVQLGLFNAQVGGTTGRMSCDGDQTTYSLSPATSTPSEAGAFHWWQYNFADGGKGHQVIHGIDFTPWAGGYTAYISVFRHNHGWLGTQIVPGGIDPVPYVKAIRVPLSTPDGREWRSPRRIELPEAFSHTGGDYPGIDAEFVRITLGPNMYYSGVPDGFGRQYRCGLREVTCRRRGSMVGEYSPGGTFQDVRWTFTMASHPVRGYWVVDSEGWVHGFGDAADWDSDKFGAVPITAKHPANKAVGIAAHPSGEGYWVVDRMGHVYAYGAAKYYGDPVRYWPGSPPSGSLGPALTYEDFTSASPVTPFVTDITAHYNGEGYWVSHGDGLITLHGSAATLNEVSPVTHFGTSIYNGQQMHFTGTPYEAGAVMDTSRRGSDGGMHRIIAFLPSETHLTTLEGAQTSEVHLLEPADNPFGFVPVLVTRGAIYRNHRKATAISAHPHLPFVFVTDGSGNVWTIGVIWRGSDPNAPVPGSSHWRGQLYNRIYNKGQATEFRLGRDEYPNGIEVTATGKGYWLAFGSGRIASFGDAEGQGPINIWENKWVEPVGSPPVIPTRHGVTDWSFFRALTHDISRDPDGKGFYVLLADGSVRNFDAKPWGQPGFHGQTGWRWHDGNMEDYSDIVRDLLRWAGFTLYGELAPGEAPPVYGNIETTGVYTDTKLDGTKWDKRTLIDCINQIKDVVAYNFWIDQEGAAHFECVDEETEILTSEGWKRYDQLQEGDLALAYDRDKECSTWTEVQKVNTYEVFDQKMLSMEGRSHSSLTTPNHRWWVEDIRRSNPRRDPRWADSSSLTSEMAIRTAAPYGQAAAERTYEDDFVALVGWWITEGSPSNKTISQSHSANPEHTQAIEDILTRLYGHPGPREPYHVPQARRREAVERVEQGERITDVARDMGLDRHSVSRWSKQGVEETFWAHWNKANTEKYLGRYSYQPEGAQPGTVFYLGKQIMQDLNEVAPDRVLSMEFILALTEEQIELLLRTALAGDGSVTRVSRDGVTWGPYDRYHQPSEREARAFEILCALSGRATHTKSEKNAVRTNVLASDRVAPVHASMNDNGATTVEWVSYSGTVWCPTLSEHNVWLARRNGTVFYTGNSPNWWYKGNRDELGRPIFVTYDENGDWTRVDENTPGAQHFVPTIDEEIDLSSYAVQLDGKSLRSEIIVGSDIPDPDDPTITSFVRYLPESAHAEIRPGVPALRGIQRPALWVNQVFTNKEEQKLMAELVALQIWFSQRVGSVSCTGNPNIWINDQVMIKERHTSEYYVHYVRSVSRTVDVDKGTSEMTLSTNWLGNDTEWVLTTDDSYDPLTRFRISEVVDRWQHGLGLGLPFSGGDSGGSVLLSGEFD